MCTWVDDPHLGISGRACRPFLGAVTGGSQSRLCSVKEVLHSRTPSSFSPKRLGTKTREARDHETTRAWRSTGLDRPVHVTVYNRGKGRANWSIGALRSRVRTAPQQRGCSTHHVAIERVGELDQRCCRSGLGYASYFSFVFICWRVASLREPPKPLLEGPVLFIQLLGKLLPSGARAGCLTNVCGWPR